jgi:hypothetical protein
MELPDKHLMTVQETFPFFDLKSEDTFRTWIKRGKLPQNLVLKIGTTIKIRKKVLEKYLNGELTE